MRTVLILAVIAALAIVLVLFTANVGAAPKLDRNQRPTPGPVPPVVTPRIVRVTLSNGLPVWVVTRRELPLVDAVLQIRAGAAQDGAHPGIAAVTASLLDEGTSTRSSLEFAGAVDLLGANLSASGGIEQTSVSLLTLSRHLDAALGLMGEMVVHPAFKADELERERKARLQNLKQQKDVATTIADKVLNLVLYGEDHPYGHPVGGTTASIAAIARDDVAGFYDRYYRPNNAVLIVVGDVTAEVLAPKLEKAFAGWTAGTVAAEAATAPARPAAKPAAVYLVDKPNAAQSEIRIGQPGTSRTADPDYYALQVLNTTLGGQFTSRINLNLRERHGYTYGARSTWAFRRGDGPFVASGGVFTAKTDSSLVEFLRELQDIRGSRPITEKETEFARNGLLRGYPRRFETPDATAGVLAELALHGLPDGEIANYLAQIGRVKPEDVTRVAAKYLTPDQFAIVVVGDLATIRPGIEALNLGPITVLDADGKPVVAQ
ncbi:MAG: insulinase family protein [Candidatus Eisenbacteria bacterium]|uniref:Insulinase family protein n=1 Tax=Eiseniibacteriota bacterium TaxID=2212470 RepID=A0A538UB98_UNCEI|nr:MAG: insulinase family protein [Candidatus Eisenbacteria bacterium]